MIRFVCECGRQLQAREESAGKRVLCPACQRQMIVPDLPATSIQPEEPAVATSPREQVQRERPLLRDESEEEPDGEERPRRQPEGSSGKATTSLVLGILSLFCNVLTGLPAIIVGILALRDINRSQDRLTGRGLATAGVITACVGTLLSCVMGMTLLLPALLLPAVQKVREAATRVQSQNNLKQLGLAMMSYNAVQGGRGLPTAAICDKNGKPLLSWRVALLPFIEQQPLYSKFKLDEPWDGPNNIKLLAQMPAVYKLPGDDKTPSDRTHYQVFVGNGAAFEINKAMRFPADFPDGLSNTILIVEAENVVPWTKPEDVPFDPNKPILPLMSKNFRSGFHVALADGSVRMVVPEISESTLKLAIIRNDGMPLGPDW